MEPLLDNDLNEITEVKRGGCLSAFLIAMIIFNPVTGIYYLFILDKVKVLFPNARIIYFYLLILFAFINTGLAIATWQWKKFGVIGFWISAFLILIINLMIGVDLIRSFMGLLGPFILTLLVRQKWEQFR